MIEGIIGKKIGMSQIFDSEGNIVPVTVIQAGPCTVIQKKTLAKEGYAALQLGLVEGKGVRKPVKAQLGHFKKSGVPVLKTLREFRCTEPSELKEGDQVLVDIFEVGEKVSIVGTSKGKGFAGVVKRHHFAGGGGSHGSMFHRAPGSIGASSYPVPGRQGDADGRPHGERAEDRPQPRRHRVGQGEQPARGPRGGARGQRRLSTDQEGEFPPQGFLTERVNHA